MGSLPRALKTPEDFSFVLASRPAGKSAYFGVHLVSVPQGRQLGFILPKRFVKRAVWRNQIKRWSRAALSDDTLPPFKAVIRVSQPLKIKNWAVLDRCVVKKELLKSIHAAIGHVFS